VEHEHCRHRHYWLLFADQCPPAAFPPHAHRRSASCYGRRWRSWGQRTGGRSRPAYRAGATSSVGTRERWIGRARKLAAPTCLKLTHDKSLPLAAPCRWIYKLSPAIDRSPFTPAEDAHIVTQQHELGNRWAAISRGLAGRTDSMVQRRWKLLVVRCLRRLVPGASLAEKLDAIGRLRQGGPVGSAASGAGDGAAGGAGDGAASDSVTVKRRGRRKAGAASSSAAAGARVGVGGGAATTSPPAAQMA